MSATKILERFATTCVRAVRIFAVTAAAALSLSGVAQAQTLLSFDQVPTLESGTALQQGAVYRFANVSPGVDARMTLAVFSNALATLALLDDNTTSPARFQPTITCQGTVSTTCYVRFNIQLVNAGTNTPATRPGLILSAQDVDSAGTANISEFVEIIGATTVSVANPTYLSPATALQGGVRYIHTSGVQQNGVGTDDRFEVYARYNGSLSSFGIVGGNTIGTTACGANNAAVNCRRLNSYSFSTADANSTGITITKVTQTGTGTFGFTGTNGYTGESITTTTPGVGVAGPGQAIATPGTATTITETTPPAGFTLVSVACTGIGTGTATPTINGINGGSVALNAAATAAGNTIACTFTNRQLSTDLSITKTNTPANGVSDQANDTVVSGATTTYQLVVTNSGTDPSTGAVVRDTPGAGITCPGANVVTCSSTATPSACPTSGLTIAGLTSGLTLGTLPATAGSNTATFTFSCTVQ